MGASSDGTIDGLHDESLPGPLRTCTCLGLASRETTIEFRPNLPPGVTTCE